MAQMSPPSRFRRKGIYFTSAAAVPLMVIFLAFEDFVN
jgi:hypothetical protein